MEGHGDSAEGRRKRIDHVDAYALDTYTSGEGKEQIEGVMGIIYTIVFFLFLVGVYYLVSSLFHLFTYLDAKIPNKFLLAQLVALGALISGVGLYLLREHRRMLYALLEMAVAIVTGGAAVYKVDEGDLSVWLALAASTYLVVRSLENMQKAGFKFTDKFNNYLGRLIFERQGSSGVGKAITPGDGRKPDN